MTTTLNTRRTIASFDEALDAEQEKAVRWYQEQLNAINWTELEISMFELMEICCNQLESHIRKADPRTAEQEQKFEGFTHYEILTPGFCFNQRRLDIYNRYCAQLADRYNESVR